MNCVLLCVPEKENPRETYSLGFCLAQSYNMDLYLRVQKYRNPQKQVAILGADIVRW